MNTNNLTLIAEGKRSKIYQDPTNENRIIKVTNHKSEKAVINYFFKNPCSLFVNIYSVEKQGSYIYATMEKLPVVDFAFTSKKDGSIFVENMWQPFTYKQARGTAYEVSYINSKVSQLNATETEVKEYYSFLDKAGKAGLCIFDTAWNLGKRLDGSLVCFDSSFA